MCSPPMKNIGPNIKVILFATIQTLHALEPKWIILRNTRKWEICCLTDHGRKNYSNYELVKCHFFRYMKYKIYLKLTTSGYNII